MKLMGSLESIRKYVHRQVKLILGFNNAYRLDEELRKAYQAIIQWMKIIGFRDVMLKTKEYEPKGRVPLLSI